MCETESGRRSSYFQAFRASIDPKKYFLFVRTLEGYLRRGEAAPAAAGRAITQSAEPCRASDRVSQLAHKILSVTQVETRTIVTTAAA